MLLIVPDHLHEAIKAKLDPAIAAYPGSEQSYRQLYEQLLAYYNEHGEIPDFTVTKTTQEKDR